MASRSEPAPLSAVLVTVSVDGSGDDVEERAVPSSRSSRPRTTYAFSCDVRFDGVVGEAGGGAGAGAGGEGGGGAEERAGAGGASRTSMVVFEGDVRRRAVVVLRFDVDVERSVHGRVDAAVDAGDGDLAGEAGAAFLADDPVAGEERQTADGRPCRRRR